jgi:uncharacterized protein with WD repeat
MPDIQAVAFSPDGRSLASSHLDWILIWDIASATMRRKFRHPHGHGCKLTFGPDGPHAGDLGPPVRRPRRRRGHDPAV